MFQCTCFINDLDSEYEGVLIDRAYNSESSLMGIVEILTHVSSLRRRFGEHGTNITKHFSNTQAVFRFVQHRNSLIFIRLS